MKDHRIISTGAVPPFDRLRYEVMPFGSVEEAAGAVSHPLTLAVTCSPKHGVDRTVEVGGRLRALGHRVVVHIATRMVYSDGHVDEILGRLRETGIDEVFLVGGDQSKPLGPFSRGMDLLPVLKAHTDAPRSIGVPAYPEGHPLIDAGTLAIDLRQKSELVDYMTTQMCFSAGTIVSWLGAVRDQGIELPAIIGIPGLVDRKRLLRIALQVGVGTSASYLRKQHGAVGRLFGRGEDEAERLYGALAPTLGTEVGIAGFHVFTFNRLIESVRLLQSRAGDA